MAKIKSITRYVYQYQRKGVFDDEQIETKKKVSYTEFDQNNNNILDIIFDNAENIENRVVRVFDAENLQTEEHSFNDESSQAYENKYYTYNNRILTNCRISYEEGDEFEEQYISTPEGHLLKKNIVYGDGDMTTELECTWENNLIQRIVEYDDYAQENIVKSYNYNEKGQLVSTITEDKANGDKTTEEYVYQDDLVVEQKTYNLKDMLVSVTKNIYNGKKQLIGKTIETASQYLKYIYSYNEQGMLKRESLLNKDDIVLSDKEYIYNSEGLEKEVVVSSRNIIENEKDEMLLTQKTVNEYQYWD